MVVLFAAIYIGFVFKKAELEAGLETREHEKAYTLPYSSWYFTCPGEASVRCRCFAPLSRFPTTYAPRALLARLTGLRFVTTTTVVVVIVVKKANRIVVVQRSALFGNQPSQRDNHGCVGDQQEEEQHRGGRCS